MEKSKWDYKGFSIFIGDIYSSVPCEHSNKISLRGMNEMSAPSFSCRTRCVIRHVSPSSAPSVFPLQTFRAKLFRNYSSKVMETDMNFLRRLCKEDYKLFHFSKKFSIFKFFFIFFLLFRMFTKFVHFLSFFQYFFNFYILSLIFQHIFEFLTFFWLFSIFLNFQQFHNIFPVFWFFSVRIFQFSTFFTKLVAPIVIIF